MTRVSDLSPVSALTGTELTAVVQAGGNRSATINQIATSVLSTIFIGADITVNTYADLPAASANTDKFAWVLTSTGMLLTKKASGWYLSNGTTWSPADPPTSAASGVSVDNTGFLHTSHNDVQDVLADLDAALVAGGSSSADNALARYDGTTGKLLQNSSAILDDSGNLTVTNIITTSINIATNNDFSIGNAASADSSGAGSALAFGNGAVASAGNAIAIGPSDVYGTAGAVAAGFASLALGAGDANIAPGAYAGGEASVAIGAQSYTDPAAVGGVAIGAAFSYGYEGVAIGVGANAGGDNSTCVTGNGGEANGDGSLCFGDGYANGFSSTYLGNGISGEVTGDYSMVLGVTSSNNLMKLSGSGSLAIFMQDQSNRTLSVNNTMMLLGGSFLVDPSTGAAHTADITSVRSGIDFGRVHDALIVPTGASTQQPGQTGQPTAVNGMIRYDTTSNSFQGYINGAWKTFTLT